MCARTEATEQTSLPAVVSAAECVHEITLPHNPAVFSQLPKYQQTYLKAILLNCNDLSKTVLIICRILFESLRLFIPKPALAERLSPGAAVGQRSRQPPQAVGLVCPCRPRGPQRLLQGRFRTAPKSSHKTSWTSSSWSVETCASIAASLDADALMFWEKSRPNEAQGWEIQLGGCSCPGWCRGSLVLMALLRFHGITGLSTEVTGCRGTARFLQGRAGSAGPFPALKALSRCTPTGPRQSCGTAAALDGDPHFPPLTPHFELCLQGSVTCRGQTHGQASRKIVPMSENQKRPFYCFSGD